MIEGRYRRRSDGCRAARAVLSALLLTMMCCLAALADAADADPTQAASDSFVGTGACRGCHADAFAAWQGSHHDLAMAPASDDAVLGNFADASVQFGGVTSTFRHSDGAFTVRTDGPDGKLDDFPVAYTFGVTPLQQYLIERPDGRLQSLGIAWDSRDPQQGGQRWFHLYPDEPPKAGDDLHWTGPLQNWNYMCATCHSTNFAKGYDAGTDTFRSTWTDIDVGCESCHGPGADHVAWAGQPAAARAADPQQGWLVAPAAPRAPWRIDPATGSAIPHGASEPERIEICADCHSRRGELAEGHETSPHLLDHFAPSLLSEGLYHPDGQIDDEVYVWGSFVQSRMYQAGVVCGDCHEPHSLKLRAPGSAVCAQCHQPAKFAAESHHHHPPDSAGADCLACHMPEKTYMVVDPRRDHSLRIPRPDLSVSLGTPNACNGCHTDQDARWASAAYQRWYPDAAGGLQNWASAFARARQGDPRVAPDLVALLEDPAVPAIARATAVEELAPFLAPASAPALEHALQDDAPLVALGALRALEVIPPPQRYPFARHLLTADRLAVRAEAGRVLAAVPIEQVPAPQRGALQAAVDAYAATQQHHADRAEGQSNLASLHAQRGDVAKAIAGYRRAIELDPGFVPAYANLADLLRGSGEDAEAIAVLEQGIHRRPEAPALHHSLGLARVRAGDYPGAVEELATAVRLEPDDARFAYVLAIARNSTGDPRGALTTLERALRNRPYDRDLLLALATLNRDAGDLDAARRYAERMVELRPEDGEAASLVRALQTGAR